MALSQLSSRGTGTVKVGFETWWSRSGSARTGPLVVDIAVAFGLALAILILLCQIYNRTSFDQWSVPIDYAGDTLAVMAKIKACADGEMAPVIEHQIKSLNAPFEANWNDWPDPQDPLWWATGIVARSMGLFAALNFSLVFAHLLAGLSFYIAGRLGGAKRAFSFAGALAFGLSVYIFARGIPHIMLSYCWHVPLCLLVSWWACQDDVPTNSWKWIVAVALAFATGLQNPYYALLFLQLLGFAVLARLVRRQWAKATFPVLLGCVTCFTLILINAHSLTYRWRHGANPSAIVRDLAGLEHYGLVWAELFLPVHHRWQAFADFARTHYFDVTLIRGEIGSAYLGVLGIAGLLWMIGSFLYFILSKRISRITIDMVQIFWVLLYSVVGGINLILGVFGLVFFRCTNRFSIAVLALALLFLVRQFSRLRLRGSWVLALGLAVFALWDQLPPRTDPRRIDRIRQKVESDHQYVKQLEALLAPGSMVFQLPVMDYPEVPPILAMTDYEHFRPYLFSRHLRFSYGSNKGRARENWQHEIAQLPIPEMVSRLRKNGFSAIHVNRKAYADSGKELLNGLRQVGLAETVRDRNDELVAVLLRQSTSALAEISPTLGEGFYGWETAARNRKFAWSKGSAELNLRNESGGVVRYKLRFELETLLERSVSLELGNASMTVNLTPGDPPMARDFEVELRPGNNVLRFETNKPAELPGNGDTRPLAFSLTLLEQE